MERLSPRTIALVVDQGFAARYLLRTEVLPALLRAGARVVIVSPNADEPYFREEFEKPGVTLEQFDGSAYDALSRRRLHRLVRNVRWYVMNAAMDLHTVDLRYGLYRKNRPRRTVLERTANALFDALVGALRRSRPLRRAWTRAEERLLRPRVHEALFRRLGVDTVVVTSLGVLGHDHYVMRDARGAGARVASVILSWDNTSTKGMPGATADRVVAWTERMRDELIGYTDVPAERIDVAGIAHFDIHTHRRGLWSRAELFERLGLDPGRRLLLFAPRSPNKYPWNPDLVELLGRAVADETFPVPCQVLVRVHPLYYRAAAGQRRFQRDLDRLLALRGRYPHVVFDEPRILSDRLPMDLPASDQVKLASEVAAADVLLSFFSTMMLEAALHDVPMVNVCLFPHNEQLAADERDLVTRSPHIRSVIETGGVRSAFTEPELLNEIRDALAQPGRHAAGRKRIREIHAGPEPARAGARVAEAILRA